MPKLTKQQRRAQRARKKLARKKRQRIEAEARSAAPIAWVAPRMKLFRVPTLVNPEAPREQRLQLLREIGDRAQDTFNDKYPRLSDWFRQFDAVYLLSYCAFYFVSYPEGTDPEVTGDINFFHHYIEILQALALYQERNLSPKPLLQEAQRLRDDVREIGDLMGLRLLRIPPHLSTEKEVEAYHLQADMMLQTTAVRNWAYRHQLERVVLNLCAAIRPEFAAELGLVPFVDSSRLEFGCFLDPWHLTVANELAGRQVSQ